MQKLPCIPENSETGGTNDKYKQPFFPPSWHLNLFYCLFCFDLFKRNCASRILFKFVPFSLYISLFIHSLSLFCAQLQSIFWIFPPQDLSTSIPASSEWQTHDLDFLLEFSTRMFQSHFQSNPTKQHSKVPTVLCQMSSSRSSGEGGAAAAAAT